MSEIHDRAPKSDAQHDRVIETLVRAFHDDLAFRWMFPDEASRPRRLRLFFPWVLAEQARVGLTLTGADGDAVTLWRPPGQPQAERPRSIRELVNGLRIFGLRLGRAMDLARAVNAHLPSGRDFLYLQFAAVHPDQQGRGLGPRTIQQGLTLADEKGLETWLETTSPRNVALYQRMGFQVEHEWQVPNGGPVFWTMKRPKT